MDTIHWILSICLCFPNDDSHNPLNFKFEFLTLNSKNYKDLRDLDSMYLPIKSVVLSSRLVGD